LLAAGEAADKDGLCAGAEGLHAPTIETNTSEAEGMRCIL
jgi:hypothetical protein